MSVDYVEKRCGTAEYAAAVKRFLRQFSRRAATGDVDITALEQLADIRDSLDTQMAAVVRHLRTEQGGSHSWTQIGDALGMTRSGALRRFGPAEDAARRPGGQPLHLR